MHPYRDPPLDSTNSMWCCVCREHTLHAESFRHPSSIGYVNVCKTCIYLLIGSETIHRTGDIFWAYRWKSLHEKEWMMRPHHLFLQFVKNDINLYMIKL